MPVIDSGAGLEPVPVPTRAGEVQAGYERGAGVSLAGFEASRLSSLIARETPGWQVDGLVQVAPEEGEMRTSPRFGTEVRDERKFERSGEGPKEKPLHGCDAGESIAKWPSEKGPPPLFMMLVPSDSFELPALEKNVSRKPAALRVWCAMQKERDVS